MAPQPIVAWTTMEAIGKGTAQEGVVALQPINPVRHVAEAAQLLRTRRGAAHHHPLAQLPIAPHHRIAEAEALHSKVGIVEVLENPHGVTATIADHQIAMEALDRDLDGGHIQPTQFILKALQLLQGVATIATSHHIEIIARPSAENVLTASALENIIPLQAREAVVAGISLDPVGGSRALHLVGSGSSRDHGLDGQHRAEQHREGIQAAANGLGQGAEDGGPDGAHVGQAAGEPEQGHRIQEGATVGRQGRQQVTHLEAQAAIGLHCTLHSPEQGAHLHLGGEETVDGPPKPCEGILDREGDITLGHLGPDGAAKAPAHQLLHGPEAPVGVLIAAPTGQHLILNAGPGENQGLEQGLPLERIARDPLLQQGRQGAMGAGGDGLMQPGHHPHSRQLRQGGDGSGNGEGIEQT